MPKKNKVSEPSKELLEKKEFLEMQKEFDLERHKRTMDELKFRRESDLLHHNREMERQRIKTAEIRKAQERKAVHHDQMKYGRY